MGYCPRKKKKEVDYAGQVWFTCFDPFLMRVKAGQPTRPAMGSGLYKLTRFENGLGSGLWPTAKALHADPTHAYLQVPLFFVIYQVEFRSNSTFDV